MRNPSNKQVIQVKILSIIIFCAFSNLLSGQFSVKVLNEDFSSNSMRWDTMNNENYKMEIIAGKYVLSNKAEGAALTSTIEMPHLQSENYQITANLSKNKGINNNGFGITWGGTDANNEFEFVISGNGYFKILKWENGEKETIYDWTYQSAINKWDFSSNELKIKCLNNIIRFSINGNYVAATRYLKPLGQKLGFVLNETMEIEINDLVVENLAVIETEKSISDFQNVKINKLEYYDGNLNGVIENGENTYLTAEIINNSNYDVNDLILKISPKEFSNGLTYNPIVLIDNLKPGETKPFKVFIVTNENIRSQKIPLTISLSDINNVSIDSKVITVETQSETNYSNDFDISDPDSNNNNNPVPPSGNDELNACATGCLISILAGILQAIFE